jgi:hypothetical protein
VDAAAGALGARLSASNALAFWAVADRQGLSQLAADALAVAWRVAARLGDEEQVSALLGVGVAVDPEPHSILLYWRRRRSA